MSEVNEMDGKDRSEGGNFPYSSESATSMQNLTYNELQNLHIYLDFKQKEVDYYLALHEIKVRNIYQGQDYGLSRLAKSAITNLKANIDQDYADWSKLEKDFERATIEKEGDAGFVGAVGVSK